MPSPSASERNTIMPSRSIQVKSESRYFSMAARSPFSKAAIKALSAAATGSSAAIAKLVTTQIAKPVQRKRLINSLLDWLTIVYQRGGGNETQTPAGASRAPDRRGRSCSGFHCLEYADVKLYDPSTEREVMINHLADNLGRSNA